MSTAVVSRPAVWRAVVRWGFPWLALGLTVLSILALWWLPSEDFERAYQNFFTGVIVFLGGLALLLWLVGFSGANWWIRGGTSIAIGGLLCAAVVLHKLGLMEVKLTGDIAPTDVRFPWSPTTYDRVEAHRKKQEQAAAPAAVDLSRIGPADYPEYRGPKRDGIIPGPPLSRDWQAQPPRLLWRQPVGEGHASFAVVGDAAVTIEQRRDQEAIVCYDTATGRERWVYSYATFFTEKMGGVGPRATPTIAGGDVFSLGAAGKLVCLNGATGEPRWDANILKNNTNLEWAMSGLPLVYDNLVVVNPGSQASASAGRALVAYDRQGGKVVWTAGSMPAGYCSPMLATLAGKRQVLLFDGEGIGGYDAEKGTELWRLSWETNRGINVAQPLVLDGGRVFVSSGYGVGCAMLKVSESGGKWTVEKLWHKPWMRCKFTSPVVYQGFIYGLDDGVLMCIDEKTGERKWKGERYGHGQLLLTGNLLLIQAESGKLVLVEADPEKPQELASIQALKGRTWNHLALANGKAYVRNYQEMACYDLTDPSK